MEDWMIDPDICSSSPYAAAKANNEDAAGLESAHKPDMETGICDECGTDVLVFRKISPLPYLVFKPHKYGGVCDIPGCGKTFDPYCGFLVSGSDGWVTSSSICDSDHIV